MKLTVLGCGEAFDTGLGNNSSILHGRGLPTILFDCGYQIPERLWRHPLYPEIDGIYFTHLHADHSFGVVPLLTRFWEEKRRAPFRIAGPRGVKTFVMRLMQMGYPGVLGKLEFALEFEELRPGDRLRWDRLELRCARTVHPVMNLAVRVDGPGGRAVGISGDGAMSEGSRELFRDVDLLLHEVYSLGPGAPAHENLRALTRYVDESPLRRIGVTHVSRGSRSRLEKEVTRLARRDRRWAMARPGWEVTLGAAV